MPISANSERRNAQARHFFALIVTGANLAEKSSARSHPGTMSPTAKGCLLAEFLDWFVEINNISLVEFKFTQLVCFFCLVCFL